MQIDDNLVRAVAEFIDYMNQPNNALAVWIATSGILAGAYLAAPFLPLN